MSRHKLNRKVDRRVFNRTAKRTRLVNIPGAIAYRGGIRL